MNAVIFDLDGTHVGFAMELIYCGMEHRDWNGSTLPHVAADAANSSELAAWARHRRRSARKHFPTCRTMCAMVEVDRSCMNVKTRLLRHCGRHPLSAGWPETLETLEKDYALFVVSNSQDGYVQAFLHWSGLTCFRDIEMAGRTGLDKGANIRLVMERNGVTKAVYVGDTQGDADAAAKAGIPFIFTEYGFGTGQRRSGAHRLPAGAARRRRENFCRTVTENEDVPGFQQKPGTFCEHMRQNGI